MERRKKVGKGKLLPSGVTKLARNSAGKKEREIISDQLTSAAQDPSRTQKTHRAHQK